MTALPPTGADEPEPDDLPLAWRNRRVLAERCNWPTGALEACEAIESAHPDWNPSWRPANTIRGFEAPAGFYAIRANARGGERGVYGEDPDALRRAIEDRYY